MYRTFDIDPIDVDADGIAESQSASGAESLSLDGALCDLGTAGQFDIADAGYSAGIGGCQIGITSAGDETGVVFTITGKDQDGQSTTEAVTGVDTGVAESTKYWSQITDIATDGATTSTVTVGPVDEIITRTIPLNWRDDEAVTVAVQGLSGTCQYDIDESFSDLSGGSASLNWNDAQANKTANLAASLTLHAKAVRLKFDSYSSGAELQFTVASN